MRQEGKGRVEGTVESMETAALGQPLVTGLGLQIMKKVCRQPTWSHTKNLNTDAPGSLAVFTYFFLYLGFCFCKSVKDF